MHIDTIDHYIKEVERVKYYCRYMDDSYILHPDKEYLKNLLSRLQEKYAEFGVKTNDKKTHISKIKNGFTFLKTRFYLTDTGKVVKKPCRESITRERRKLKKQAKLFNAGELSIEAIEQSFNSWKGSMQHRNTYKTVTNMQNLFNKLFRKGETT